MLDISTIVHSDSLSIVFYVVPSTKILEIFFKGNTQLFTTIAKFEFGGPQNYCN